jgi:KipI family sensor histidine kinase inhibitor
VSLHEGEGPGVQIVPYGEDASYVDLGLAGAPDRGGRTLAAAEAVRERLPGADVVVGAGTLVVAGAKPGPEVAALIAGALDGAKPRPPRGREHRIPAVYDGPDLPALASRLGLSQEAIVALHAEREYLVELVGFLPGFAYLGPVDPRLVVPRLPSPRPSVPASSIGVAGAFTGIYPFASPGGWNLIARALGPPPFDPSREPPGRFAPGDRVRFIPSAPEPAAPPERGRAAGAGGSGAALEVLAAPACATIQDAGRPGQLARGLPPSGPLDAETHAAANTAAGNPPGAAAIEIPLGSLDLRARGSVVLSVDGAPAVRLADGERLLVPALATRAVRYLAVHGGIGVPMILGARATLLVARIGGTLGRPLRRGDVIDLAPPMEGGPRPRPTAPLDPSGRTRRLTVLPGPHLARFPAGAMDVLLGTSWRISRVGDRTGVRLEGGRIPRGPEGDLAAPVPMVRGAVEVVTDGTPIVLGPDHPTTGGYPVLAVLDRASQSLFARLSPGDEVGLTSRG